VPTLGTTLFSLTPDWRQGANASSLLERVADAECGPAIEVIGHQAWRGFPELSASDERDFRDAIDRLGLMPAALGVYTDLYRRPGRPMNDDEAFDDIQPQLEVAARLGFEAVRATLGMTPDLLRRVAVEAERLGVVLTFEVQGVIPPDAPAVIDVVALQQETGSPYLGLTLDFSLTTPALPDAFGTALCRLAVPDEAVTSILDAWQPDAPVGQRMQAAFAAVAGHANEPQLQMLIAGIFGRTGRQQPQDWAHLLPLVRHAHAKFWDPDVESVRAPHGAWLSALDDAAYDGAVLSEWGGHELLDSSDVGALTATRAHLDLLGELTSTDRTRGPA
jgi:hypothetical protein